MSPWIPRAVVLAAGVALVVIRAPHGQRSRKIEVVENRRGALETALLAVAWIAFFLPLVWVASPLPAVADTRSRPPLFCGGLLAYALGLWLFHRSHADLGPSWSITLELRKEQRLVTHGVYRRIRHPMYAALLLYGLGQALVLPNWVAGPSYLAVMLLVVAARLGPEERMLRDAFGAAWEAYAARTKRLLPGVW